VRALRVSTVDAVTVDVRVPIVMTPADINAVRAGFYAEIFRGLWRFLWKQDDPVGEW
jgi:hypothetical protein